MESRVASMETHGSRHSNIRKSPTLGEARSGTSSNGGPVVASPGTHSDMGGPLAPSNNCAGIKATSNLASGAVADGLRGAS